MSQPATEHGIAVVPRRIMETVLGPIKVVPECKAQAVCVNGLKCWEDGQCLRAASTDAGRS